MHWRTSSSQSACQRTVLAGVEGSAHLVGCVLLLPERPAALSTALPTATSSSSGPVAPARPFAAALLLEDHAPVPLRSARAPGPLSRVSASLLTRIAARRCTSDGSSKLEVVAQMSVPLLRVRPALELPAGESRKSSVWGSRGSGSVAVVMYEDRRTSRRCLGSASALPAVAGSV